MARGVLQLYVTIVRKRYVVCIYITQRHGIVYLGAGFGVRYLNFKKVSVWYYEPTVESVAIVDTKTCSSKFLFA